MERRSGTRPQRILLAEDADDIRAMWKAWLTYWGFAVDEARNGAEAIRRATEDPPDLILMDLWMPIVDGFVATQQLKQNPRTRRVPVLALSAQAHPPGRDAARQAGCDAFLEKPIDPDELLHHLRAAFAQIAPGASPGGA